MERIALYYSTWQSATTLIAARGDLCLSFFLHEYNLPKRAAFVSVPSSSGGMCM